MKKKEHGSRRRKFKKKKDSWFCYDLSPILDSEKDTIGGRKPKDHELNLLQDYLYLNSAEDILQPYFSDFAKPKNEIESDFDERYEVFERYRIVVAMIVKIWWSYKMTRDSEKKAKLFGELKLLNGLVPTTLIQKIIDEDHVLTIQIAYVYDQYLNIHKEIDQRNKWMRDLKVRKKW